MAEEQEATRITTAYKAKLKRLAKQHNRNLRQELEWLIDQEFEKSTTKEPAL